jgi:5-methylcytosine-specific restriction endonuclease McrA
MGFLDKLLGLNKEERTESSKTENIPTGYNYKLLHEKQNPLWSGPSEQQIEGLKYVGKTKFSVPLGDCLCGCNGEPMTYFDEWELDYHAYKDCPARRRRKLKAKLARKEKRRKETEKRQAKQAEEEAFKLEKVNKRLELWASREKSGLPAKSRKEAIHRKLETYEGNRCKRGHEGTRLTKNGECEICNSSDKLQRFAMRRAEFPENLTEEEKEEVLKIYSESKRLTKESGVKHHVDHIKPLSKGGRHHPSNLQILTAEENLKKSNKWEE